MWDDNLFFEDGAPRPRPAQPAMPYPLPLQLRFSLWVSWTLYSIMQTLLCAHAFLECSLQTLDGLAFSSPCYCEFIAFVFFQP